MRNSPISIRIPNYLLLQVDAAIVTFSATSRHQCILLLIDQGLKHEAQQKRLVQAKKTRQRFEKHKKSMQIISNKERKLRKAFIASIVLNAVLFTALIII